MTYPELLEAARRATEYSYAPYSGFRVGAAALTDDGTVVTGCNIENAAYSPSICAERVAVFSALAQGKKTIVAIAVATPSASIWGPSATGGSRSPTSR